MQIDLLPTTPHLEALAIKGKDADVSGLIEQSLFTEETASRALVGAARWGHLACVNVLAGVANVRFNESEAVLAALKNGHTEVVEALVGPSDDAAALEVLRYGAAMEQPGLIKAVISSWNSKFRQTSIVELLTLNNPKNTPRPDNVLMAITHNNQIEVMPSLLPILKAVFDPQTTQNGVFRQDQSYVKRFELFDMMEQLASQGSPKMWAIWNSALVEPFSRKNLTNDESIKTSMQDEKLLREACTTFERFSKHYINFDLNYPKAKSLIATFDQTFDAAWMDSGQTPFFQAAASRFGLDKINTLLSFCSSSSTYASAHLNMKNVRKTVSLLTRMAGALNQDLINSPPDRTPIEPKAPERKGWFFHHLRRKNPLPNDTLDKTQEREKGPRF